MIKYLGSKRILVPAIVELVKSLPNVESVLDLFSGTSRVGHALKREGYRVMANDHNAYAAVLGRCYVQADKEIWLSDAKKLIKELNAVRGSEGYFTRTYCHDSQFFQPHNGARVDAIRDLIAKKGLEPELEAIALTSLMEAADRVDSTTGVQMAYLKNWASRSYNDINLRVPDVLERANFGKGRALELDAAEAVEVCDVDVAYLDPPYNQHKYLGNYHIWETLVRWDRPDVYGVARKRVDCRSRRSRFNSRPAFRDAFAELVAKVRAEYLIISFSDEGYLGRGEIEEILAARGGHIYTFNVEYPRYVGAQIGIYNPKGERVGRVGRMKNMETLFLSTPHRLRLPKDALAALNEHAPVRNGEWRMEMG